MLNTYNKKESYGKILNIDCEMKIQTKTTMIYLYTFNWQKLKRLPIPIVIRGDVFSHFLTVTSDNGLTLLPISKNS